MYHCRLFEKFANTDQKIQIWDRAGEKQKKNCAYTYEPCESYKRALQCQKRTSKSLEYQIWDWRLNSTFKSIY